MKVTITRADGGVYKDDLAYHGLDMSSVPLNVHALQWDGTAGWIEFVNESEFRRPPNEPIDALPDWAHAALQVWQVAADAEAQAKQSFQEQATVQGAQTL